MENYQFDRLGQITPCPDRDKCGPNFKNEERRVKKMNDLISKSRLKNELLKIPSEMGLIKKAWVIQTVNKQEIQDSNNNCNCRHNSNSRDNEPCCRCDSRQANADRIRNMSDEELAEWIHNMCEFEKDEEPYKSIYNLDTEQEEEIHDSYGDLLKWLQSEAE